MMLMRSFFAMFFQFVYLNRGLKAAVWDDLSLGSTSPLVFRTIQGALMNIIIYAVTRDIPLSMMTIVVNMSMITMTVAGVVLVVY